MKTKQQTPNRHVAYRTFAFLLLFPMLLIAGCIKDDSFPQVENITKGEKWTIKIGSTSEEVFSQLQSLNEEKNFNSVSVGYRQALATPEQVQKYLGMYDAITVETKTGKINRALINLNQTEVTLIETGGAMLDTVSSWPQDVPNDIAIHSGDQLSAMYNKLLEIHQVSPYNDYEIILPNKPLDMPYDPDMANYSEWHFAFSEEVNVGIGGNSSVDLFFNNGKLSKIRHEYSEHEIYN